MQVPGARPGDQRVRPVVLGRHDLRRLGTVCDGREVGGHQRLGVGQVRAGVQATVLLECGVRRVLTLALVVPEPLHVTRRGQRLRVSDLSAAGLAQPPGVGVGAELARRHRPDVAAAEQVQCTAGGVRSFDNTFVIPVAPVVVAGGRARHGRADHADGEQGGQ